MRNTREILTVELHKELDLIQACITRMANNSFYLKGWFLSLATIAITLLLGQDSELLIIGLFLFGFSFVFWGLDGFFLKMETLYRWKYEWVIQERQYGNDSYLYDLNPYNKKMWLDVEKKNDCLMRFVFSKTLIPLYGIVWMISIVILLYSFIVN